MPAEMKNRELDALIAEKVMGLEGVGFYRRQSKYTSGWEACGPDDFTPDEPSWKADRYYRYGPHGFFIAVPHYTTNAEASKQLRQKLREAYDYLLQTSSIGFCFELFTKDTDRKVSGAEDANEFMAVALCALKAVEASGVTADTTR